jgi:predicted RNA-binding protein
MGAFICALSEQDWQLTLTKGIYGNRYLKEGTEQPHSDNQQLSIIRDLISMKPNDLIFFHIRGKKTIHGVYEARSSAFFDDSSVWANATEKFPYRFLFQPSKNFSYLCDQDADIEVHSLYELIDSGQIKSLVTLEFEQNIEARSVRKILVEDANEIIKLLHRDFRLRSSLNKVDFKLIEKPNNLAALNDRLYKVGSIENAIKAILLRELAYKNQKLLDILNLPENYDFVNEFIIAPTFRKAIDILVKASGLYLIIEVKTNKCEVEALKQALYYRDLLRQRNWVNNKDMIEVALVAQSFASDLIKATKDINSINDPVRLLQYSPTDDRKGAMINDATPY